MSRFFIVPALLIVLALPQFLRAQCPDPAVPPGGFPVQQFLNLVANFSDGARARMDVRMPVGAPGPCGWPLIVFVHGGGGDRSVVAGEALNFASHGYITCAYDVRGQGDFLTLNPLALAHTFQGVRELIDLFEVMEQTEAFFPPFVDFNRIGVTGYSQGAQHSWWAGQHSGRVPPPNPWRVAPFPVISAIVPKDSEAGLGSGPNGNAFSPNFLEKVFVPNPNFEYRPAEMAFLQPLVLAENFAAVAAFVNAPGMDATPLLQNMTVPVFAHVSYDDKRVYPSSGLLAWTLVPNATPKKFQAGTGGHDSPSNQRDRALFEETRRDWFNRFLKSVPNGVASGNRILAEVTPENVTTYQDSSSLWDFRVQDAIPAPTAVSQQFFMAAGGNLQAAPAVGPTANPLIHAVPPGFAMPAYVGLLPTAAQLAAIIPPDSVSWTSPPLATDRLMQGIATIELRVNSTAPDYQLHAVIFDVAPNGAQRWVTSDSFTTRGALGLNTVTIHPYLQSYAFRQGHRIRVTVENMHIHRPPTGSAAEIEVAPVFMSSVVTVIEGGATQSSVTLPFLPYTQPVLAAYPLSQSAAALVDQRLTVHTNSAQAGNVYLLLPSLSGSTPGTPILGITLPVNFDALTNAVIANPATPPFVNASGLLGATGSADMGLAINGFSLPPAFIGVELTLDVAMWNGVSLGATNAVTIPIVP